jgi:hypothetical protein
MFRPEDKHLDPLDGKLGVLLIKQLNDRSTGGGAARTKAAGAASPADGDLLASMMD